MNTVSEARKNASAAKNKAKEIQLKRAREMHTAGYSNVAIADALDISESSVRNLMKR